MRIFCLLIAGTALNSCTSTIREEKEKVLNDLLREPQSSVETKPSVERAEKVQQEAVEQESLETVEQEAAEQEPTETVEQEAAAQESADKVEQAPVLGLSKANLPPALPRSTRLNLPLPRGSSHADLVHFLNAYTSLMQAYKPFENEWRLFSGLFSKGAQLGPDEFLQYRVRVRENPDRTHWLFVWGVYETSNALLGGQRSASLLLDRQQDFTNRMRTLVYLMSELELAGMKAGYRDFLRVFYKNLSAKYFKRILRDRPAKPRGLIEP